MGAHTFSTFLHTFVEKQVESGHICIRDTVAVKSTTDCTLGFVVLLLQVLTNSEYC